MNRYIDITDTLFFKFIFDNISDFFKSKEILNKLNYRWHCGQILLFIYFSYESYLINLIAQSKIKYYTNQDSRIK